jgi:aryl-alcohol dehydrogenase-like predicted oxidoreductase
MEKREFGRTGLSVSLLTFGCGAVGGLMTKGQAVDQDRAVARALDFGINHFDTAALYGDGASEENLGRALGARRKDVLVSTKVRIPASARGAVEAFVRSAIDDSLRRLKMDYVDLYQLHNTLAAQPAGESLSVAEVMEQVVPAFEKLRDEGKIRFLGLTANGDAAAIHTVVASGAFQGAQVFYNALNPSAGTPLLAGYPAHDYGQLLDAAQKAGVGTIVVRVLAGGALSGSEDRHPLGMAQVDPIGSGRDYAADVARARRFRPVIGAGHAASLSELAVRYVISNRVLSTIEVGLATIDELEAAVAAVLKGPLPGTALEQIATIQRSFCGEPR